MNRDQPRYITAPLIAAVFAGPFFLAAVFLAFTYSQLPKPIEIGSSNIEMGELSGLILGSLFFGWFIAVTPCAIGTAVMAHIGKSFPGTRMVAVWIAAGMAVIGAPAILLGGFSPNYAPLNVALTLTGGFCAALCRRFTTWGEAPLTVPAHAPARAVSQPHPKQ